MKKIILGLLLVGAIGGTYGYYEYNRKPANMNVKSAEVTISATDLATQYDDARHLGKVIQVSGKVSTIISENGKTAITLDTGDPLTAVVFEMATDAKTDGIATGNDLILRGQCDGKLSDIQLSRGVVVK